jgi:uncharacterized protein
MKSLSIKPINCRQCPDCYEAKIKDTEWNIDKVMKSLREYDKKRFEWKEKNPDAPKLEPHTVHGGEPLLLPFGDLRRIFRYNYKYFGRNGIQTNLLHLRESHIDLFNGYNMSVGISIDGLNGEMNKGRFPKDINSWDLEIMVERLYQKMDYLYRLKIGMNIISLLRSCNSNIERIFHFIKWISSYEISHIRLTPCTIYHPENKKEEINNDKLAEIYISLFDNMHKFESMTIAPISDIIEGMMGNIDNMVCNFKECDPFCTTAEITLMGNGELGGCLHSGGALDGLQMVRGDSPSLERYKILKQIPQENGGCLDCKWWHMCHGACPGQAIDNDFRNRTRFCEGYKKTFEYIYTRIKSMFPNIYLTPDYFPDKPDKENIQQSIFKSVNRRCDKIPEPRRDSQKWKPLELPGGILHQDSNSLEWRKLNPGWKEKAK